MPELEPVDVTKLHVEEYPNLMETTKIIADFIKKTNTDDVYLKNLLFQDKDGRFPYARQTYEKYHNNMTPEIEKLYRSFFSALQDKDPKGNAFINTMLFLSNVMGESQNDLSNTYLGLLVNYTNNKTIDPDFAYMALVYASKRIGYKTEYNYQPTGRKYILTTFYDNYSNIAPRVLQTLAKMPQSTPEDMELYAGSLRATTQDSYKEVIPLANDAMQKLDAQLDGIVKSSEVPDIKNLDKTLSQRKAILRMVTLADYLAPINDVDKHAEIRALASEVIEKYKNDNWLNGNNIGGYTQQYEDGAAKRVVDAEQKQKGAEGKAQEVNKQMQDKDDEIARLKEQIQKLEADKQNLSQNLQQAKDAHIEETKKNKKLEEENRQLQTEKNALQQKYDITRANVNMFIEEATRRFKDESRLTRGVNLMGRVTELSKKIEK